MEEGRGEINEHKTEKQPPLAGKDFLYYWNLFRWPFFIALAVNIILYVTIQPMVYIIFTDFLYFVFLGWMMAKREKGTQIQTATLGTIAGLALGFFVSVFKLIYYWKVYLFFNIITETLATGLAGLLFGAAIYLILHRKSHIHKAIVPGSGLNTDKNKKAKGGEQHGR
ncbi:hypothetical protein ACFL04_02470 [Patescibacteria group bacterium]